MGDSVARQLEGVLPQRENELIEIARLPRASALSARHLLRGEDRSMLLSSGISLFEPPKPEEVVAGMAKVSGRPAARRCHKVLISTNLAGSTCTGPAVNHQGSCKDGFAAEHHEYEPAIGSCCDAGSPGRGQAIGLHATGNGDFRLQPEVTPRRISGNRNNFVDAVCCSQRRLSRDNCPVSQNCIAERVTRPP